MIRRTKEWYKDQVLLGCTIDNALDRYKLELQPGPEKRLHVGQNITADSSTITDIHLAGFELATSKAWLDQLVNETRVLVGYQSEYAKYSKEWTRYRSDSSAQ